MIVGFNIAWSSSNHSLRHIGRGLPQIGWDAWLRTNIDPLVEMGVTRFELHNPFGADAGEAMDFDQAVEMQSMWWRVRRQLGLVHDIGPRAFAAAVDALRERYPNIEIITYLGSLCTDRDMASREAGDWLTRFADSLHHVLNAGCRVGFDASSGVVEGSREYRAIQLVEALGGRPVIEAWPHRDKPHLHGFDCLMRYGGSYRTYQTHADSPIGQLTGERIVLVTGSSIASAKAAALDIIRQGDTPILWPELAEWYVGAVVEQLRGGIE